MMMKTNESVIVRKTLFLILVLCLGFTCKLMAVDNLRCEMVVNPMGIDIVSPRLSWELNDKGRNVMQTSYRILVASAMDKLKPGKADLWDSGKVSSDNSAYIPYGGVALKSRMTCYWKVCVTTNKGKSEWSKPARWTMGLLDGGEWKAQWIGLDKAFEWDDPTADCTRLSARYFRKDFRTARRPAKATLYICGLGVYKLHINGKTIGRQELAPTPTDYRKEVKYNTFDVTGEIGKGDNAIGVIVGNGRFFHMRRTDRAEFPKLIAQLELEYGDGSREYVVSDASWKVTSHGAIGANNEYDGEEYDARREMPGWDKAGFDDSAWLPVDMTSAPEGKLGAQINNNIQVMDVIRPTGVTRLNDTTYILDMGQNFSGRLKMKVKGERGREVKLRFAEFLNDDGSVNLDNLRGGLATDKYTLKGEGKETWVPCFAIHGFRYVEITNYPGTPSTDDFEGQVLYDDMRQTGYFATSDSLINQIYHNAYWSVRSNYRGMPTDCPQRTERMGWTGDRAIGSYGESFLFDNNNLYAKWVHDIRITQREDGSVSDIAPSYWSSYTDNMTWPGTYLTVSKMLYTQFGNIQPITEHYASMKKWLYYMRDKYLTPDHIMPRDVYGDWCTPPEVFTANDPQIPSLITDKAVIGTAYYYYMLKTMSYFASLLDKDGDRNEFDEQAAVVKDAYNNKFLDKEKRSYSNNTVTSNLLALSFGLVPDDYRNDIADNMVRLIEHDFKGHISTGVIGCQWLMRGLTEIGRPDLAYGMLQKTDYPSFGYMIKKGATTVWEHWNGDGMERWIDSQNHVMLLGDLLIWFYEDLAGIKSDDAHPGFKKLIMRPLLTDTLNYVDCSYHSVHGQIVSSWKKDGSSLQWHVIIPANTSATVYIPATAADSVTEGGKSLTEAGIRVLKTEGGFVVCEIGSGTYSFRAVR